MKRVAVVPNRVLWMGLWGLLGLLGLLLALPAHAEDPPARAGRIADISGEAWIFDSEARDWERLSRNQTVAEGDRLRSDGASRVTLRIGSTTLWLDERSELELERLDDERVLLRVERGSVALKLRSREQAQDYRLLTREGRAFPDGEGLFRVEQMERGTRAAAWQGRLRFEFRAADADPVWLDEREQAELWWSQGPRTERQPVERDAFANWLHRQRETEGEIQAYRYVSPEMTGAEDLDRYGRWDTHVEYGPIWYPYHVGADWAPYRDGRWVWTIRWGWTWVDAAPWGFAPFHYGRWVRVGGRWSWAPGRYVPRPVYAPALVGWTGPQLSIGVRVGPRPPPPRPGAWVPLAPREVYQPVYRHTPAYRERINREHDPVTVPRPGDHRPQRPLPPPQVNPQQPGPQQPFVQPPLHQVRPRPQPPQQQPDEPMERPRPPRGIEPGVPMSAQERAWQRGSSNSEPVIEQPQQRRPERQPERSEPERRFERGGVPAAQPPAVMPPRPVERPVERPIERPMIERPVERAMPPAPPRAPQPITERARPAAEEPKQDKGGPQRARGEANRRGEQSL